MEKINVAELLKDCPSGMELDCTMFDGVYFDHVDDLRHNSIKCYVNNGNEHFEIALDEHGQYISNNSAKCVIFPKGKTTWEGFHRPFKDGDIVTCKDRGSLIAFIYKERKNVSVVKYHFALYTGGVGTFTDGENSLVESEIVFATEEEKAELFDAIKANGYKWNAETKTLEKLVEPKFKVGDRIKNKTNIWSTNRTIKSYDKNIGYFTTINDWVRIEDQDDWELINEPKFKVGDRVKSIINQNEYTIVDIRKDVYIMYYATDKFGSHVYHVPFCDEDKFDLVTNKFDITTLKPFDSRVLVRHNRDNKWCASFFSHIDEDFHSHCYKFVTTSGKSYPYCIPYEGNEHLLNTTNDCDEFYRNL